MSETNWAEYDEFIKAAEADNRLGIVSLQVESNELKTSKPDSSGNTRQYHDIVLAITSAGGYKIHFFMNPEKPSVAEMKAAKEAGDMKKLRGMNFSLKFFKDFETYYGIKGAADLKPGVSFIGETKRGKDRGTVFESKPGFIELQKVLPKDTTLTWSGVSSAPAAASSIPF